MQFYMFVSVCQHVITRVLDIPDYEAERGRSWFVLTLHQFMLYFNEENGLKHIEDVASESKSFCNTVKFCYKDRP